MPIRVQQKRTKGWRMPPNTVSVARPGKLGNPFRVGDYIDVGGKQVKIESSLHARTLYMENVAALNIRLAREQGDGEGSRQAKEWVERVKRLRGKNLACFCKIGQPCHADALLEIANAPDAEIAT